MKGTITWVDAAASNLPTEEVRGDRGETAEQTASTLQKIEQDMPENRVAVTLF